MHEIIIGLIVTALGAAIAHVYRRGHLHRLIAEVTFWFTPSGIPDQALATKEIKAVQSRLIRLLLRDQSTWGGHRGQFGKSCDAVHSSKWQSKGSGENMTLKPRMYLTYWPVFVLHNRGVAIKSQHLAISGVTRLFVDGLIPVFTSEPDPSPTKRGRKWSLRHSMAGAYLLALANPNNQITLSVVDQMIDDRNAWQDASGGWWHTSEKQHAPDLWASAYALKLLDYVVTNDIASFRDKTEMLTGAMERTVIYLDAQWESRRWAEPSKVLMEENLVLLFIDLAPILLVRAPALSAKCTAAMKEWLSPAGDLSTRYLETLAKQSDPVHPETAYARMAYAFYRAKDPAIDWHHWFEKAARSSSLDRLFSAELAFLFDLSFAYEDRQPSAGPYGLPAAGSLSGQP